jgi:DNA-binding MarR family transcriptional regulator
MLNYMTLEDAFMALHQKMAAALRKEARNLEYTLSQLEVLNFVVEKKNPTMKDIAAHMRITAPSATTLVEYLYAQKLVVRKPDPHDRRGVRIFPTSKTLHLFSKFKKVKTTAFKEILRPLSAADRNELTAIFNKLTL